MRESIIIVKDFYDNPDEVREYAFNCIYYDAYENIDDDINHRIHWEYSRSQDRYVTDENISKLENIIGAKIDIEHFKTSDHWVHPRGCKWNAGFQIKSSDDGTLTTTKDLDCIHEHINDNWNQVPQDTGWTGVLFLTPDNIASKDCGTAIWYNNSIGTVNHKDEWICDTIENYEFEDTTVFGKYGQWDLFAQFQFKYNTLVLMKPELFHAGLGRFGNNHRNSRIIQTFFFKEK